MGTRESTGLLSGSERLEVVAAFGRPVRVGCPADLGVSDVSRVTGLIRGGDGTQAGRYLDLLRSLHSVVNTTYVEWALALIALTATRVSVEEEGRITAASYERWAAGARVGPECCEAEALECVAGILEPEKVGASSVESLRSGEVPAGTPIAKALNAGPEGAHLAIVEALGREDWSGAEDGLRRYVAAVRGRHDLTSRYVSLYGSELARAIGEQEALGIMQAGLEGCAVLQGLWAFVAQSSPEERVLMLSEHLRAHWSGEARDGRVEIVDEGDRYRLVFDPCGSGGALRRQRVAGIAVLREARPETWGRACEVSVYCAHCAMNELTSIKRLGYLAWVTEFTPDGEAPCGWTVYKDGETVPEEYYERVGARTGSPRGGSAKRDRTKKGAASAPPPR